MIVVSSIGTKTGAPRLVIWTVMSLHLLALKIVETSSWMVDLLASAFIINSAVAVNFSTFK